MYSLLFNMISYQSIKKISETVLEIHRDNSKGYFYLYARKNRNHNYLTAFFSKRQISSELINSKLINSFIEDEINSDYENSVISKFLDEDISAIIDSFKIESKSKFIESIETSHVSLDVYECECGYHLSFDSSYLKHVSIVCPSCDKLTIPDQESETSEVQDFIKFKNEDHCFRWYASCANNSRFSLELQSSKILVNIDKDNNKLMSDLKKIVTESGLIHFCVTDYKLDLT